MIKTATHIEIEYNQKKYHFICESDCQIQDFINLLESVKNHYLNLLKNEGVEVKEQLQEPELTESAV